MKIEIINSGGEVFTTIENVQDGEREFAFFSEMYGPVDAASWREYVPPASPSPTLDELRSAKRTAINAERDRREAESPFLFNGHLYDYDPKSRERINKAISAAIVASGAGVPLDTVVAVWTLYDNATVDMTVQNFLAFPAAEAERSGALHEHARTLKQAVDDALESGATAEEIEALPTW